jgi:hypothetical protein
MPRYAPSPRALAVARDLAHITKGLHDVSLASAVEWPDGGARESSAVLRDDIMRVIGAPARAPAAVASSAATAVATAGARQRQSNNPFEDSVEIEIASGAADNDNNNNNASGNGNAGGDAPDRGVGPPCGSATEDSTAGAAVPADACVCCYNTDSPKNQKPTKLKTQPNPTQNKIKPTEHARPCCHRCSASRGCARAPKRGWKSSRPASRKSSASGTSPSPTRGSRSRHSAPRYGFFFLCSFRIDPTYSRPKSKHCSHSKNTLCTHQLRTFESSEPDIEELARLYEADIARAEARSREVASEASRISNAVRVHSIIPDPDATMTPHVAYRSHKCA